MKSMNTLSSIIVASLIGASSMALYSGSAMATEAKSASHTAPIVKVAPIVESKHAFIKTVSEAMQAVKQVHEARIAIFEGTPAAAVKLTASAEKDLQTANSLLSKYAVHPKKQAAGTDEFVPFGTSVQLAEGFTMTKEKQAPLKKAKEHMAKGEHTKALEVLKLAKIELSESVALLPIQSSMTHVKQAAKLMKEKKYYEASQALKAVEDSVLVDVYTLDKVPAQGKKG